VRVAVIFVAMVVLATPSHASSSCMSKAEARQHFGQVHIYWHGPDHCWNATPGRRQVARVQRKPPQVQKQEVQARRQKEPEWRESRSEMLPDSRPVRSAEPVQPAEPVPLAEPAQPLKTRTSWHERSEESVAIPEAANWADGRAGDVRIAQAPIVQAGAMAMVAAPVSGGEAESMSAALGIVLLFFGMALASVGVLVCVSLRES